MLKTALRSSVVVLSLTCLGSPVFAETRTAWRLFVSDHSEPVVKVFNLEDRTMINSFQIKGPASLKRSASGRTVFALQGSANTVTAIASGVSFDDHGDHGDISVESPKSLLDVAGTKPTHFVEHGGQIALFFDGEGVARLTTEKVVLEGKDETTAVNSGAPHHGVAAVFGGYTLISAPNKAKPNERPVGINLFDKAGKQVGDTHACPGLHGEATSGNLLAFACETGLLIVAPDKGKPAIRHVAYPKTLQDGKTSTMLGGKGLQYFLGNYGADKLALIEPTAKDMFRLIDLPVRRVHFVVDPVRAKFAYVFTEDGKLHQIDVVEGAIVKSVKVTEPYSMDGHWSDPRPRIAVAGDKIAVTDPLKGLIHLIDVGRFAKVSEISVSGKPFNIVSVGGSGETHDGK